MKREAEAAGLDRVFRDAGFFWGESGCSMCAGGNGDRGEPGDRIVSTTNRNFEHRQGTRVRTHLVSPATAAATAIAGRIADVRQLPGARLMQPFSSHTGIAVPLLVDDLNTDQIAPVQAMRDLKPDYKKLLFMRTRAEEPDFVLNKPQFRNPGILVSGNNFGAGSSREAAVWGMLANNIRVIVAKSFADIYRENCLQNGLLPVVLPAGGGRRLHRARGGGQWRGAVHGRSANADDQRAGRAGHHLRHRAGRPHAAAGGARRHRADAQAHRRDRRVREAHGERAAVAAKATDSRVEVVPSLRTE